MIFNSIFFVVVTSTLVQGATFEPLARRLGVTDRRAGAAATAGRDRDHPPARRRVARLPGRRGRRRRRADGQGARAAPRGARQPDRPRRGRRCRRGARPISRRATSCTSSSAASRTPTSRRSPGAGASGPLGEPPVPALPPRGAPQVFSVRPWTAADGDPARPRRSRGSGVAARLRTCGATAPARSSLLADGRYAVTSADLIAVGGTPPARRLVRRGGSRRQGLAGEERAWWQEVVGAIAAPASVHARTERSAQTAAAASAIRR